jgi:type VI secretion system protein VasG
MKTNLKHLIGKLDPLCRRALESSANLALARTHHEVDLEHVLLELIGRPESEAVTFLRLNGADIPKLEKALRDGLGSLKTGNTRNPVLSVRIVRWVETAWMLASVDFGATQVRSAFLMLAMVLDEDVRSPLGRAGDVLAAIPAEKAREGMMEILRTSKEGQEAPAAAGAEPEGAAQQAVAGPRGDSALAKFTTDLTAAARAGKLDPVLGRDGEIRQIMDILLRRRQNNPILTGEPGVGKTAVVEGLALRIAEGDVPEPLKPVELRVLDLGLLQAGASVKGEFEARLRGVIDEVKASLKPMIIFIDEAHTLIGAGGGAGAGDAANLLKPALARGELRTIAATTWSEYKKYFEKDAALARRFQVVKVEEPDEDLATQMLRGIIPSLEKHHKVRIRATGVKEAVRLSSRYISGRQLPDKAVSLMDTACARVALSRAAVPEAIEDARRNLGDLEREKAAIEHEEDQRPHAARLAELAAAEETQKAALKKLEASLEAQRGLLTNLDKASDALKQAKSAETPDPKAFARLEGEWAKAFDAYRADHKANPMIHADVDEAIIAEVVSGWTGIPLGRMVQDEIATVQSLSSHLQQRVVGQNHAMDIIARQLQIAWSGLEDPTKPRGVFLLTGPSGVGKTETALALADLLYGGERNMVIINMSEYQEAHSVSGLKGSPPGYVGFGEGGVLTEGVRRKPYCVVLLDEVEKAHPDVLELFYQVFDKGNLEDSEGQAVNFKNTVIILTSNVGTDVIQRATEGGVTVDGKNRKPTPEDLAELVRPQLLKIFKPAFIGRMQVIPYLQLGDDVLHKIIGLKLGKIQKRFKLNFGAELTYDPALLEVIRERCTEQESGARNAEAILNQSVLATLSERVLSRMAEGKPVTSGHISVSKKGALTIKLS